MADEFCELCELPLSTCVHGMPPPPPKPEPTPTPRRASRAKATPATSVRTTAAPRGISMRTDQQAFRPHILRVLQGEGPLETTAVMEKLEEQLAEVLLERDRQKSSTGEIRWQTTARAERKTMMDEGLIVPAQPGVWELTEAGRDLSI